MKDSCALYIYTNITSILPRKLALLVPLCAYEAIKATAESLIVAPNDSFANRFESPFGVRAEGRRGEGGRGRVRHFLNNRCNNFRCSDPRSACKFVASFCGHIKWGKWNSAIWGWVGGGRRQRAAAWGGEGGMQWAMECGECNGMEWRTGME